MSICQSRVQGRAGRCQACVSAREPASTDRDPAKATHILSDLILDLETVVRDYVTPDRRKL